MYRLSQVQACLLGVCLGDRAGVDVESLLGGWIRRMRYQPFQPRREAARIKRAIWDEYPHPVAAWAHKIPERAPHRVSDDTVLMHAVACSIIRHGGWDLTGCADEHIAVLAKDGGEDWGPTLVSGIAQIRDGLRRPTTPVRRGKKGTGCGIGPAMRVAPLGVWFGLASSLDIQACARACMELSLMTHWDARAGFAAYAVALAVASVLREPVTTRRGARKVLGGVVKEVERLEEDHHYQSRIPQDGVRLSERLRELPSITTSVRHLRDRWGTQGHSLTSVPFVLGVFLRHPTNFTAAILEAVLAGGDTDTHAAMVGAMVGANCGLKAIPRRWRFYPPKKTTRTSLDLAARLYSVAEGRHIQVFRRLTACQ